MSLEDEIKTEWRLYAIEFVVSTLLATPYVMQGAAGLAQFDGLHRTLIEKARNKTFPGAPPAISDHFSGELESAIDRLLGMAQKLIEQSIEASKS
jgi:hypothetical protein